MPFRSWRFRIEDIIDAINKIERYTSGLDYEKWLNDEKTIDAVIRNIEIIGEAASHLPPEIQNEFKEIPWRMMKGIRNVLAHEYFGVDLDIIWKTIKDDLPKLKKQLID